MKALIIGATGATGKDLVNVLLQDPGYTEIVIFVRRKTGLNYPKLVEVPANFDTPGEISGFITGDILFSCLGTTLKAAGSKDKQWQIDYDIPMKFATIARNNNVPAIVLLSAYGASAKSNVFYSKMKGELEDAIAKLAFKQLIIFRPGLLLRKDTDRAGERIMAGLLKFLNNLRIARKFRPLATSILAEKLAKAPNVLKDGTHIIELNAIFKF